MKLGKFSKAAMVATILIVNTVPLLAAEVPKENSTKSVETSVQNEMKVTNEKTSKISESIEDSAITTKVKITLNSHPSTKALKTSVATNDSVVTISGKAKNKGEIERVTQVVGDVKGVKSVVNNMTVE